MKSAPPSFPFETVLSFSPLIDFWREQAAGDTLQAEWARLVLTRLADAPAFQEPIPDPSVLSDHQDLLALLLSAVLPMAQSDMLRAAAIPPFDFRAFYATPAFRALDLDDLHKLYKRLEHLPPAAFELGKAVKAYSFILQCCYDVEVAFDYPLIFSAQDPDNGLDRYFKLDIDTRFVTVNLQGERPVLTPADVQQLVADPMNLQLWKKKLPPKHFEICGFTLLSANDVTDQVVLSKLKDALLQKDAMVSPEKIDHLQKRVQAFLCTPGLRLGLVCLEHGDLETVTGARPVGRSLLLSEGPAPVCPHKANSTYALALQNCCEPTVVSDLRAWPTPTAFERHLLDQGLASLLLAPLFKGDRVIGLLELASPNPGALTALKAVKLQQAVMLFATALQRSLDEREDRVQALIKKHYTAIHPVVEWRFREAALAHLAEQDPNAAPLPPIVFPDVYPLYGLSDIRNSSTERDDAIRADLIEQLSLALSVIVEAGLYRPLPILDEIGHRIDRCVQAVDQNMSSEDEFSILDFLRHDVEPLFAHLRGFGATMAKKIDAYQQALDPTHHLLYRRRRAYVESVSQINDTISAYLDVQERHAQTMFPHYFEKYQTDGVDYNIYVGDALLEQGSFDLLYLRNLRLWQLLTMCGIEWELERLAPRLAMPLETTHLILVQSTPLAIRFRHDEKRFDVDGAYNIRYEITKKRIDKARIKDSGERLTQPGRIAIVYSQNREATEYRRYLDYLQAAGYLEDQVEAFDLEDLQGLHGLKALRVPVAPSPPDSDVTVEAANGQTLVEAFEAA